jgi:hypothetical protein
MEEFIKKIASHAQHVKKIGHLCNTEETTKQALILPVLDILGFSPYDPTKVRAEHKADFKGAKNGEKVDYALFCQNKLVMLIEAKNYIQTLPKHDAQLARYFNSSIDVSVAVLTNGREWRFFTDLNNKNVMDDEPFLVVDFIANQESSYQHLFCFQHNQFQPEKLRTLAEEGRYLALFQKIVSKSITGNNLDYVRFIVQQANLQRQLTTKLLESLAPIVKEATETVLADMAIMGFMRNEYGDRKTVVGFPHQDEVNPNNSKIITTAIEKKLFELTQVILGDSASHVVMKDTESYFAVLYQGKVNRWLYRYYGDRKVPSIQFIIEVENVPALFSELIKAGLSIQNGHVVLPTPDDILRIPQIVKECFDYCQNDENFSKSRVG